MDVDKEKLKALLRKNPIGFGCGAACALLVVVAYFRSDAVPNIEQELQAKSAEADRLATNIKNSTHLKEQVDLVTKAAKDVRETRLVRTSELATNLQYFYKLETETGVKLIELRQNQIPKTKGGSFISLPFSVAVQGDYPHLLDFMRRLDQGTHFCRVMAVTVAGAVGSSGEEFSGSGVLTINLQLELLALP